MKIQLIKSKEQYEEMLSKVEELIFLDPEIGTDEANQLEVLSLIISSYEKEITSFELPDGVNAILFRMEEQGLKQRDLVPFVGSKSKVSEVLSRKRSLTVQMIKSISIGLDIPMDTLMSEKEEILISEKDYKKFPLAEMYKRKWISKIYESSKEELRSVMTTFLGENHNEIFALQRSNRRLGAQVDQFSLAAWIRRVVMISETKKLPSYNSSKINEDFIKRVISFSTKPEGITSAIEFIGEHGIFTVIEPHLPKTRLDGVALLNKKSNPVIGLTLRYDRIDYFWFTLVHELVHVWKHLSEKDRLFVDDLDIEGGVDRLEKEADELASEILVTKKGWATSRAVRQKSVSAVVEHALKLGVHPAIIAGKIRHDSGNYKILTQLVGNGQVRRLFKNISW